MDSERTDKRRGFPVFPSPLDECEGGDPYTRKELRMMAFSAAIRSKPNWHIKMKDKAIAEKWKREAVEAEASASTLTEPPRTASPPSDPDADTDMGTSENKQHETESDDDEESKENKENEDDMSKHDNDNEEDEAGQKDEAATSTSSGTDENEAEDGAEEVENENENGEENDESGDSVDGGNSQDAANSHDDNSGSNAEEESNEGASGGDDASDDGALSHDSRHEPLLSEAEADFVLKELEWYAAFKCEETGVEMSDVDGTIRSDRLIDEVLRQRLMKAVKKLEDVPESDKDWHSGSEGRVLDLVHPSLHPLMYWKSRKLPDDEAEKLRGAPWTEVLKYCGGGKRPEDLSDWDRKLKVVENVAAKRWRTFEDKSLSRDYSWLPAEFRVDDDGRVAIESYINNLQPEWHRDLYSVLEKIFERFVPMLEAVLTELTRVREKRVSVRRHYEWYDEKDEPQKKDFTDINKYREAYGRYFETRRPIQPSVYKYKPRPEPVAKVRLRGHQLQVIVKLANIHLTPDKPDYKGGVWHVEGMRNDRIVATGIYYYDVENITESKLSFREAVREPGYEQGDDKGVRLIFGLQNEEALCQILGSSETKKGRCMAFPNTLQHRVSSFRLKDPSKPGHRKILVFFLVDPGERIPSSLSVPPQQRSWWIEEMRRANVLECLPLEIVGEILEFVDWPMSLKEAKKERKKLMDERKYFISEQNEECFARPFSLCEH